MYVARVMSVLSISIKDRVTALLGLLVFGQAIILVVALLAVPGVPDSISIDSLKTTSAINSASDELVIAPDEGNKLEKLAVEGSEDDVVGTDRQVSHKVRAKDTLAVIWSRYGAPFAGAARAAEAFKEAGVSTGSLKIGEAIELSISIDGDIVELKKTLDNGRTLILQGNSVSGYEASVIEAEVVENERTVVGTIFSSLSSSAAERNIPYQIVDEFVDLFSNRVEFRKSLQPGDTFTVTYNERRFKDSNALISTESIKMASLQSGGNMLVAISHSGKDGKVHYYDEKGNALGNYFLRYPLSFTRISSAFSWARFHPILQRLRPHYGVDFSAPLGTPVRSVADGLVVEAGYNGECGNMIRIQHGDRYSTAYLHLSKIASGIKKGTRVSRGELIGAVGSTGISTGPHLHFSLYDRGKYVDPMNANLPSMTDGVEPIPPAYLMATLQTLRQQHETISVASADSTQRRG